MAITSKPIIKSFVTPFILIAVAIASIIMGIFNLINNYLGYIAFLFACTVWIFLIGYKYIINFKNNYIRSILSGLTVAAIIAFVNRQDYLLQLLLMIIGILLSVIILCKIYLGGKQK